MYALKVHSRVWKIFCQLKTLHFLDFLVMQKNGLIRKIRLISKFVTSQPGNQSNAIHILPNISRSKDNQKMKLGQLIEYHTNIFLEKSYRYCAGEAIPRPFSTKWKLKISLDQHPEFLFILFYCISLLKVDEYKNILKLRSWPLAFTFYKGFLENKKRLFVRWISVSIYF